MTFQAPYVYAETAFHHEGDVDFMMELIAAADSAGADGIKFQVLLDPASFLSTQHSAYHSIAKWTFTDTQWLKFAREAGSKGLDLVWMPLDTAAVDLAVRVRSQVKFVEIHSVSFYDSVLHDSVQASGLPLMLGVGGRTIGEVDQLCGRYGSQVRALMYGFQSFPSAIEDVRLQRIPFFRKRFPNLAFGYTDHTGVNEEMAVLSNEYAYLLGATIFEKHITTQEGVKRTDFESAVSREKFRTICERLRRLHGILTAHPDVAEEEMTPAELKYRNRQKVWVARTDLPEGNIITHEQMALKMTDQPGGISDQAMLLGRTLKKSVLCDSVLSEEVLKVES